jgi:hypothetical protein
MPEKICMVNYTDCCLSSDLEALSTAGGINTEHQHHHQQHGHPSCDQRKDAALRLARQNRLLRERDMESKSWGRFCNDCYDLEGAVMAGDSRSTQAMLKNFRQDITRCIGLILQQVAVDLKFGGITMNYVLLSTDQYRIEVSLQTAFNEKRWPVVSFNTHPLAQPYVVGGLSAGAPTVEQAFKLIGDRSVMLLAGATAVVPATERSLHC